MTLTQDTVLPDEFKAIWQKSYPSRIGRELSRGVFGSLPEEDNWALLYLSVSLSRSSTHQCHPSGLPRATIHQVFINFRLFCQRRGSWTWERGPTLGSALHMRCSDFSAADSWAPDKGVTIPLFCLFSTFLLSRDQLAGTREALYDWSRKLSGSRSAFRRNIEESSVLLCCLHRRGVGAWAGQRCWALSLGNGTCPQGSLGSTLSQFLPFHQAWWNIWRGKKNKEMLHQGVGPSEL